MRLLPKFSFEVISSGGKDTRSATPSNNATEAGHTYNDYSEDRLDTKDSNESTMKGRRSVTFHPAIVTGIYIRVSTSEEEKEDLYFSRKELQKCREEEAKEKALLMSMIKGQEKYEKSKGRQGNVTRVSLQITV